MLAGVMSCQGAPPKLTQMCVTTEPEAGDSMGSKVPDSVPHELTLQGLQWGQLGCGSTQSPGDEPQGGAGPPPGAVSGPMAPSSSTGGGGGGGSGGRVPP